jgi:NAD(P)-dependent dehydrogenase (short-subunit alcohol dehydrogenase family)
MSARIMLVTGGARGIGRAVVRLAAERGYDVAVGYRSARDEAEAAVAEVEAAGQRAVAIQADVGSEADIVAMFEACDKSLGPLDVLVNSAGIAGQVPVCEVEGDYLTRLMAVNVVGTMLCCREAVRRMSTASGGTGGAIVNISSMAAVAGGRPGAAHYAGSKGAIDSFTMGIGKEVATQGIRVNAVRPGVTITDMTAAVRDDEAVRRGVEATIPMQRAGAPEEIAEAVMWLASDAASFVTGAFINAGGGGFVIGAATR